MMNSYEIRFEYGRDNLNWAGRVDSEYRENRTELVDASTPKAAENKLRKSLRGYGRIVSVHRIRRIS